MSNLDQGLEIGACQLRLPPEHNLPSIMESHPQYDTVYWNLIGNILKENGLEKICQLVDIGANVGDSIAHYRRHAAGPVWAFEADPAYFAYLESNTSKMENVTLSQALVCPPHLINRVSLHTHDGTGRSHLDGPEPFKGAIATTQSIVEGLQDPCMIKSDTDGFDGAIINGIIAGLAKTTILPTIVTFEGPDLDQVRDQEDEGHMQALKALMTRGYRLQILTNTGLPVTFVGSNIAALDWHTSNHRQSVAQGTPPVHYYDFICVAPGLSLNTLELTSPL